MSISHLKQTKLANFILPFLAGGLLVLAFAPFNFYPLALLCPALLFFTWQQANPKQALCQGYLFGLGFFGLSISWVYISMHQFGGLPLLPATFVTLAFVVFLSLYIALPGYLLQRFFADNPKLQALIAFPALWVLFEWFRSWMFTGFPWALLGYSQTNSPLSGFAPVVGVYGLSYLLTLLAALFVHTWQNKKAISNYLMIAAIVCTAWGLHSVNWTTASEKTYNVSLLQGNISQSIKWSTEHAIDSLATYQQLIHKSLDSDIIVLPEAAIPIAYQDAKVYLETLNKIAIAHDTTIITGIPIKSHASDHYFNGIIALGKHHGIYYKHNLVPFGEYVPFEKYLRGLIHFFDLPMSDFIPGHLNQNNIHVGDIIIAPYICYEIAYPNTVRSDLPGANLLMTVSNDAWFGHSIAASQHLQIAQMRSLESGRYQVAVSNNGLTAIINPAGKIIAKAPRYQTTTLSGTVKTMHGSTPWITWGHHWLIYLLFLQLGILLFKRYMIISPQDTRQEVNPT